MVEKITSMSQGWVAHHHIALVSLGVRITMERRAGRSGGLDKITAQRRGEVQRERGREGRKVEVRRGCCHFIRRATMMIIMNRINGAGIDCGRNRY